MSRRDDGGGGREGSVQVTIFGQPYSLRADEGAARIQEVASYVDGRMRDVADRTRTADTVKIAVLAALNIADDLHSLRASGTADRDAEDRLRRMEALLDGALAGRA